MFQILKYRMNLFPHCQRWFFGALINLDKMLLQKGPWLFLPDEEVIQIGFFRLVDPFFSILCADWRFKFKSATLLDGLQWLKVCVFVALSLLLCPLFVSLCVPEASAVFVYHACENWFWGILGMGDQCHASEGYSDVVNQNQDEFVTFCLLLRANNHRSLFWYNLWLFGIHNFLYKGCREAVLTSTLYIFQKAQKSHNSAVFTFLLQSGLTRSETLLSWSVLTSSFIARWHWWQSWLCLASQTISFPHNHPR